jgi:PTH1 family peptidyl-tRNA hydrolase
MKAIVGLGNPGAEYAGTRHNVGFDVVDELARRWDAALKKWKNTADVAVVKERQVVLVEPRTFMNDSGRAVSAIMTFYKIQPADVLVVVDEVDLALGRIRIKESGSGGSHNGLKSVVEHVGREIPRLRIGIERGDRNRDLSDRVLSRFLPLEQPVIERAIARAADAAELFVSDGARTAMNRFNVAGDDNLNPKSDVQSES